MPSAEQPVRSGPLRGVRVIEMAGMGPAPMAATLLADLGADVIRVDRSVDAPMPFGDPRNDIFGRGRRSVAIDLKHPDGRALVLDLCAAANVLLEGFRPGVMERLGLGPEPCLARNPDLVYGRMTGWGQDGPLAALAGHDIDYIAVAGALHQIRPDDGDPVPPLNLVGDFGGGGMFLVAGVLSALLAVANGVSGGQVVDAAMVDGVAILLGGLHSQLAAGMWSRTPGNNALAGSAPYYGVFPTADGQYLAVGAIESHFWVAFLAGLGLTDDPQIGGQRDRATWPTTRRRVAEVIAGRTLDEWLQRFEGVDACVAPVVAPWDSPQHPHLVARGTFAVLDGVVQPAPAPRFSVTPGALTTGAPQAGEHTSTALADWGIETSRIDELLASAVISDQQNHHRVNGNGGSS